MMPDWRDILMNGGKDLQEFSDEGMAARRIMKGMGLTVKDIGNVCRNLSIPYREEETTFQRAVHIFQCTYAMAGFMETFDARSGRKVDFDEMKEDTRTGMVFFRFTGEREMTAFIKGIGLRNSPLGDVVIHQGMRFVCEDEETGMEIWEQDPVKLIQSFSRKGAKCQ